MMSAITARRLAIGLMNAEAEEDHHQTQEEDLVILGQDHQETTRAEDMAEVDLPHQEKDQEEDTVLDLP